MLHLPSKGSLYKQVPRKVKKLVAVLATSTSMTEKMEERIRTDTLHLVSCYFQGSNQGSAGLRKQSQCNKSNFCSVTRPQDLQDQRWSLEDQWHYSGDLQDSSLYLFHIR